MQRTGATRQGLVPPRQLRETDTSLYSWANLNHQSGLLAELGLGPPNTLVERGLACGPLTSGIRASVRVAIRRVAICIAPV